MTKDTEREIKSDFLKSLALGFVDGDCESMLDGKLDPVELD